MRFPRQESGSHRRLQIRGATGSVCLCNRSVFSPEPHLFWVQDDWQLGAGPNCRVSARRCARVTWEGGGTTGSSRAIGLHCRIFWGGPDRCQLKKTFLQNKPHRLPRSSAKTRGRSGLSGIHEAPRRPRRVRERAAAPRHPSNRGLGSEEYSFALCSKQKYGRRLLAGLPPNNPNSARRETQEHLKITEK